MTMAIMFPLTSVANIFTDNDEIVYSPADCEAVTSATSACNAGDETFCAFLGRWNSDAGFRRERLRVTANTPDFLGDTPAERLKAMTESLDYFDGYVPVPLAHHPSARQEEECESMATFFGVAADTVGYINTIECGEEGGSAGILGFERIDGKWYLTCIALAG